MEISLRLRGPGKQSLRKESSMTKYGPSAEELEKGQRLARSDRRYVPESGNRP